MPLPTPEKKTNPWLKELQDKSWEPEILISGIVIYGLFKIFPLVEELHTYFEIYGSAFLRSNTFDYIVAITKVSIGWLIAGFIIHLILRSFWVAYIGLSYVYGESFDYTKLRFKKRFERIFNKENDIKSNIEKLEKICSSLFSVSILFFMSFIGLVFLITAGGLGVFLWLKFFPERSDLSVFNYIIVISLMLYLFDYLTSGLLKRIPYLNIIYFPVYKVISFFSLAPLYRKIYYTFITNHPKWKVFLVLLAFIGINYFTIQFARYGINDSLDLSPNVFAENATNPKNYFDQTKNNYSQRMWIPSQTVNSQSLEVFVVHKAENETAIKNLCGFEALLEQYPTKKDSIKLDCLNQYYELELNGLTINPEYVYTQNEFTKQDGLKYFIDIDSLHKGKHSLILFYNLYNADQKRYNKRFRSKIEFYKSTKRAD